ncbi:apolipoprotein lipid transfer particle [Halictus rubicundus]|uniref:apolipoprotein lipid transfer particle n=1 Tax=Halictus rubicundus TaxID=77578 RepID=UPI00403724FC
MDLRGDGSWRRAAIFLAAICVAIGSVQSEFTKDPTSCSRTTCKVPVSRKFKYEEGVLYKYKYSVNVSTNLGGEESGSLKESTLFLDAYLVMQFTSPCEGSIKFYDAKLRHDARTSVADNEFNKNLAMYNLRFAFDDGKVNELCPHEGEPAWALNLKRGVLSMLQNNMQRFDVDHRVDELDVNGICETTYRLHEARRTSLVVKKSKNLSSCLYGSKHFSVLQSNVYRSPRSGPSKHPLLESRSDCELTVDHNVYEEVVCKDVHRLQPLSSGNTGARTESTAVLRLVKETRDEETNEYGRSNENEDDDDADSALDHVKRTTLIYDYMGTTERANWKLRTPRSLLKAMCKWGVASDEPQQGFSETFAAFIHFQRVFDDYPSLSQLFSRANTYCKTGKKHIIDALPFIGNNAAVNLMIDLITHKHVDQATVDSWVTAFALIPRPDLKTIKALSHLYFQRHIPDGQFMLTFSATVHTFCANHGAECGNAEPVAKFLSHLEQKIEIGCEPREHSDSTITETMKALKAIGNMGLETESLRGKLKRCIDDASGFVPKEVRVAAVDAHRRMPSCEQTRDLFFLNYYRNFTLNTEIRIASYLQVMRCPDYNVIKTIKHTLKMEEVNQVGSYVWSHLTNLYNSASPTNVEIQSLLTDRDLGDKFNIDRRKFSRNYDGSFFSEEYNVGANYQGNLIFAPESYIPRTATFNLTFDVFSESVNAFEITTRFEGLEYYAERFFGPEGPYSNEKVSGFFKTLLRSFREAPEQEDYWKRVKRLPNVIDNNFENPRISISYKIFGNDLDYSVLNGDKEIREALLRLNPWEKFKQMASGKQIHFENAAMFLDSTYVVPLASGLPVRLDFTGSAACNFTMSGLLDSKRIAHNDIEIVSNIGPSVSVNVVGSMAVDAFYTSAGVKLRSNVYSSGAIQLRLNVKGLRTVQLSLGLPNKKMEVFSVGTDILLTSGKGEKYKETPLGVLIVDQNDNSKRTNVPSNVIANTSCSWTALDRLVGLKLCVDYQLSNVTKDPDAPYFVLAGPTLFKISLIKSDPTAKNYLFEYKWEKTEKQNIFRVAFDTPGSQVNRELSATVFFDTKSDYVTVLLRSAGNSLVAKGTYKNTENETFIDIGFDINGTKHLDASLGYATKKFSYGYTFSPEMHLIVNNERIAALSGTIRNAWKNDVLQCDVDLTFRTKKVWSKLVGYVVKRNVSLDSDFKLDYQLQKMPKKETLQFEISLANRSSKTLTHKTADMKLHSTAYPQLNTMVTAWYQQALGHLELHAEVNSKPHLMDERHKLTAKLILSYSKMYFQNQDTKVNALIAITKPIQNLDIKLGIEHNAMGPESRTVLLIGYAPGKEIVLTVNLLRPRGLMFVMEGHANLSIPNYKAMLLDVRITERSDRIYEIDFSETSFTGYNVTARGTYSDRSLGSTVINHGLKLMLKSPTFVSDVLLYCKLYRNYNNLNVSVFVEQVDRDKYGFILTHSVMSPSNNFVSYIEGRYKSNVYSVMTSVDPEKEIRMEVHLDKWRDVHLALTGLSEEGHKYFGAEVKWDANRDPAMKIAVTFEFDKTIVPAVTENQLPERNLSTVLVLTYPGRFISTSCRIAARGAYNYIVDAAIDWNEDKRIGLYVATEYGVAASTRLIKVEGQFLTPFEKWRKTALSAKYLQEQNSLKLSGSAHWKDSQLLTAEFDGSIARQEKVTEWRMNCAVTSSIHSIAWTTVNITHKIVDSQVVDTHLLIKYNPDKVIDAWSIWYLDKESDNVFNLTGNLHLESPVTSYKKTDLKCQLQILPNWKFLGMGSLDLDRRTYTTRLIGDVRHLRESMVQFNITTPLEKFSFVRGRFGLSESNRHVVAEIVTPSGPVGIEALVQFLTPEYDCNVKLSLATTLELLQRLLLVAKLNNREADFRAAYNNMTVGFQGVWHYRNITDFHYTYLLFSPVPGFEEIGVVAKLIAATTEKNKLDLDTEFSVRLMEVRLGVRAKAGPKPPPVNIPIKAPIGIANNSTTQIEDQEDDLLDEEEEEDNTLYWHGEVEMNLAIVEPVTAELDIDHEGPWYKITGNLQCFGKKILVDDHFYIEDLFNLRNELNVITPFAFANEIVCVNAFVVDMEKPSYTMQLALNVRRNATWHENGASVYYEYSEGDTDDYQIHFLQFDIKTPLDFLKFLTTNTTLEANSRYHKTKVALRAPNAVIDVLSILETTQEMIYTVLVTEVDTPMLTLPKTTITARRDFTLKNQYFRLSVDIAEPVAKSFSSELDWYVTENEVKASVALRTWFEVLKSLEADVDYANRISSNDTAYVTVNVRHLDNRTYRLSGNYNGGSVEGELYTPELLEPHMLFHGNLKKLGEGMHELDGELINTQTKDTSLVSATFVTKKRLSTTVEMDMKLRSKSGNEVALVKMRKHGRGLGLEWQRQQAKGFVDLIYPNGKSWDFKVQADLPKESGQVEQYKANVFFNTFISGNSSLYVRVETPIEELRDLTLNGNMLLKNDGGSIATRNQLNGDSFYASLQWKLVFMVDMFGRVLGGYHIQDRVTKDLDAKLYLKNPGKLFRNIDAGFGVDVDRERWRFAGNATIGFRNFENIDGVFIVQLPPPYSDDHRFLVSYHANEGFTDTSYVIGYNTVKAKTNYASDGKIRMSKRNIQGHLYGSWGMLPHQTVNNLFNITFDNKQIETKYALYTPKFQQQDTLVFVFKYDATLDSEIRLIHADVYFPASKHVGSANVSYESLVNVNGTLTAVLPAANATEIGCQFIVFTTLQQNKRYLEAFWPENTAIFSSEYTYRSQKLDSDLDGVLRAEVPLQTRHVAQLTYGYQKRPQVTTGYSEMTYNGQKVLQGGYNSKSESRAGFEKDRIQISIENSLKPIGIVYVNQYEYSAGNEGTNYPTVEYKHVNVYQLNNKTAFNVAGESRIKTTHTGQDIHLKAIHANRTVELKTDYEILPGEFIQNSSLSLAEDVWISYQIEIENRTTLEMSNQIMILTVSYPQREFILNGSYWIGSHDMRTFLQLDWDQDSEQPRTVGALFNWQDLMHLRIPEPQQQFTFGLVHPSFPRSLIVQGKLKKRDSRDLFNAEIIADYSNDPGKLFSVSALVRDQSNLPSTRKYIYEIIGKHSSTKFDLNLEGVVRKHENVLFETFNNGSYVRSYLTPETGRLNAWLDIARREVLFHRDYNEARKFLNVRVYPDKKKLVVNGSAENTPDLHATGDFLFDTDEKVIKMMVNYTPDAVQSLRMYGKIPDARYAVFNIWRTYEDDFSISDVSFYLKLNHSRLVTSTLRWRPDLKSDIINGIRNSVMDLYNGINADVDYWKQYVKSETVNVITDVWYDAQEDLQQFLDDWNDLKVLKEDLDKLKVYLNDSYNANDFYIKDVVTVGIYVIDELSLRHHIESLPNILNEIWAIMGESGEAIRNSLLWVINAAKNALNKVSEIVSAILRGDSITQVASIIEKLLEKYDKLIKDLHVSFIKYMENLYGNISQTISQQWHRFLLLVEPVFIRAIHYLETVAWKASKEVLDFLYDRRNDLISSPYFDRFTNFTQDIDKVYRDIKANDIVTNVRKYTGLVMQFLKERYFTFVPFGKELKDVVDEIVTELKELQKLPSIHYAIEKMQQAYDRAYYLYDYLGVRAKLENVVRLIHSKLMDISQSALQAESQYREAKTKFIFDPNQGLMCLEQKLPMSWHAFNQTPEFHEIPEFRAISDMRSYFITSNVTFWSLYRYKAYMEPLNWLPPFRATAMIIGSQHLVTFDGRHLDFVGPCTYLLARDFVHDTFTILIKYNLQPDRVTHKIVILIGKAAIELDIFDDTIQIVSERSPATLTNLELPIELENGTTFVYQAENIITVERKHNQLRLECNLKFDLCTLELSGWYHGKTAGLLGTMNDEPMDDTTASNGVIESDVATFAGSWTIDEDPVCRSSSNRASTKRQEDREIVLFCEELLANRLRDSEFLTCFAVVDPEEYLKACSLSTSKTEACTVALGYIQDCMYRNTFLRIPDACTSCKMVNGSQVQEGQFKRLEGENVPMSTDVVFIVEGKSCNRDIKQNRSMEQLVSQLGKELNDQGLEDTRWSLVVFGADGVFDQPRSVVFDGQIFTKNAARFVDYFDHVPVGDGSRDVFAAIVFATKLVFRAGVSKTFILMPCSHCEPENQTLDFTVLHEALLEHDVTLHILMDGDFGFEKERLNKIFYGLDATKSYTKKDSRTLTGDVDLRRQVKLSKSALGYCTPLSLENNGTIFSGDKLRFDKMASIKKFISVFSKRVALTALPNPCQNCECTAENNGVTRMECIPCIYPTPVTVDYDAFNDSLTSLEPLSFDYEQIDVDDN